jgi:uroporphyrinogen-III decarboxylase
MTDVETLYNQRLKNYEKTVNLEQPDYVLISSPFTAEFTLEYAGYSLYDGYSDPEKLAKAVEKIYQDFDFDIGSGIFMRLPLFYKILGAKNFIPGKTGFMQHPEVQPMREDEYPELIEDPLKFIIGKIYPRIYDAFNKPSPYNAYTLLKAYMLQNDYFGKLGMLLRNISQKYGDIPFMGSIAGVPLDIIADCLRGFTGISKDIRRQPENVIAACNAIYEKLFPIYFRQIMSRPPGPNNTVFMALHMPVFMRTRDFEKIYLPTFKAVVEKLCNSGYYLLIFFEGDWTRYFDILQEFPKRKIVAWIEYGDMKLAKEKLKDVMCLTGFYPITLVGSGTKQQCIDKAKEVLDTLAPNGGYIFSFDKHPLSVKDVNIENLRAVMEYVRINGKY